MFFVAELRQKIVFLIKRHVVFNQYKKGVWYEFIVVSSTCMVRVFSWLAIEYLVSSRELYSIRG